MSSTSQLRVASGFVAAGALAYAALQKCMPARAEGLVKAKAEAPTVGVQRVKSDSEQYIPADVCDSSFESAGGVSQPEDNSDDSETCAPCRKQPKGYKSKHACGNHTIQGKFMDAAVQEAKRGVGFGEGGPFGACIVSRGKVVARAHNMVLQTNDPTAHAEVTCIRKACAKLGRFDLSDCVLYTSCEPCPMCFGAIHWAKIPVCVYAADRNDAAAAGFDDKFIYDAIKGTAEEEHVKMVHSEHRGAVDVFGAKFDSY